MSTSRCVAVLFALAAFIGGCPEAADQSGRESPDEAEALQINATVSGSGIVGGSVPLETIQPNAEVGLLAMPSLGWRFVRWEGDVQGGDPFIIVTVTSNLDVTAIFERIPALDALFDVDGDSVSDSNDNCMFVANADQTDSDGNGVGDACQNLFDSDFDLDGDGIPHSRDNCPLLPNPDQTDSDGDGTGDACSFVLDSDQDGVPDEQDNCPLVRNPDQADGDGNGVGDACTLVFDTDGDGVTDSEDNCAFVPNPGQLDTDADGQGDACEFEPPDIVPVSLEIADIYGDDVIELSDETLWEVTSGSTSGWSRGDEVQLDGTRLINLDELEEVTVELLGDVVLRDRVDDVSSSGEFLRLSRGTLWQIEFGDRLGVALWLTTQRVVVAQESQSRFNIVRESDGRVAEATPFE